jgi:hypothetical protein
MATPAMPGLLLHGVGDRNEFVPALRRLHPGLVQQVLAIEEHLRMTADGQTEGFTLHLAALLIGLRVPVHVDAVALEPVVDRLQVNREPRTPAVLVAYDVEGGGTGDTLRSDLVPQLSVRNVVVGSLDACQSFELRKSFLLSAKLRALRQQHVDRGTRKGLTLSKSEPGQSQRSARANARSDQLTSIDDHVLLPF